MTRWPDPGFMPVRGFGHETANGGSGLSRPQRPLFVNRQSVHELIH